jgi:hypothetical protein
MRHIFKENTSFWPDKEEKRTRARATATAFFAFLV